MPQVFPSLSVFDNLCIAAAIARGSGGLLALWLRRCDRRRLIAEAEALVELFRHRALSRQPGGDSAAGRAQAPRHRHGDGGAPRLLLLDEPTSGISSRRSSTIMDLVMSALQEPRITVLFVEHDMEIVGRYADRVLAFDDGTVIADGDARAGDPGDPRMQTRSPAQAQAGARRTPCLRSPTRRPIGPVPIARRSLELADGTVCGLIGRNGAGKTTLMRAVMGDPAGERPAEFDTVDLLRRPRIAASRTASATCRRTAGSCPTSRSTTTSGCRAGRGAARRAERLEWIFTIMPELRRFADRRARQLTGGQQKMVALARALMAGRRMLLLDEPFEGLAPALAQRLGEVLANLKAQRFRC